MDPAPPAPPPTTPLPRFERLRVLGAGGMGIVEEAFDRARGQVVALKRCATETPACRSRLAREHEILSRLRHPNVVAVHELVCDGARQELAMEVVDGVDLVSWIRGDAAGLGAATTVGPTPTPETAELRSPARRHGRVTPILGAIGLDAAGIARLGHAFAQLAAVLVALDAAGIVHGDLKPDNVLVTPQGRVVAIDFGIATRAGTPPEVQAAGHVVGTPAWMAPEQLRGEPLTPATDAYALGELLFTALVGRPPFSGPSPAVMAAKVELEPPRPTALVEGVPRGLDLITGALLGRDPAMRPAARAIAAAFACPALLAA